MLAMQYSFTLPADYDMAIIRQRIAANGHKMDGFPGLVFKAFLYGQRDPQRLDAPENLYAPFYLWENSAGLRRFLASPGFAALTAAFGWPAIRAWPVWQHRLGTDIGQATWATREILSLPAHATLAERMAIEQELLDEAIDNKGALGGLVACDTAAWSLVRFHLWRDDRSADDRADRQAYKLGHLSTAV